MHSVCVTLRTLAALVCVLGALATACTSTDTDAGTTATTSEPTTRCSTPSRLVGNEIEAKGTDGTLWGLALGPGRVPPRVGDEVKIVWRMTGNGPLKVVLTAPNGVNQPLVFGPEAHDASTYDRPGDEWGTGFHFTMRGCWHIRMTRADNTGDVWLDVRP